MRRFLAGLGAAVALGVAGVLAVPTVAAAAESPGPGYIQGLSVEGLGTIGAPAQINGVTGWSIPMFDDSGFDRATNWFVTEGVEGWPERENFKEMAVRLPEPSKTTGNRLRLSFVMSGVVDDRTFVVPASFTYGDPDRAVIYCANTEWALPSEIVERGMGFGGVTGLADSQTAKTQFVDTGLSLSQCRYVFRIELQVTYMYSSSGDGPLISDNFVWKYSQFLEGRRSGLGDPIADICNQPGADDKYAECKWITGDVDGADFEAACSGAPQAEWLNFEWLGAWIGHYARCLFVPLNGWDRYEVIPAAFEGGAIGQALAPLSATVDSIRINESCGVIVGGQIAALGGIVEVSTCQWSEWGGFLKGFLAFLISILFGLWALTFIVGTVTGLFGRRTTPVAGDED